MLACFGAAGSTLLRRLAPALDPVERFVYGVPLGWVVASLALLAIAGATGLTRALVAAVAAASLAVWLAGGRERPRLPHVRGPVLLAFAVLAVLAVRWLVFWTGALTVDASGLWASQLSLYGDAAQHLGDVASFAYGDNFPPRHPRFPGEPFNYHYLTSITTAALVKVGLVPWTALCLHGFLGSVFVALAVFVFGRRLGLSHGAASLALVLLVLGGGLAWWGRFAGAEVANIRWLNVFFALIAPQRGLLYGLPLGLLVVRLLGLRAFVAAGLVAGLLPFAHLGTLLALALLTPAVALLLPDRRFLAFFATWALVAGPQLFLQQAGSAGAAGALRFEPGWVAAPDPWALFWLKNLGAFLPLLAAAFFAPLDLSSSSRRLLCAFQPLFVVSNLLIFQPWNWDNTKVLVWWYLASCMLVAALLARWWRSGPSTIVRPAIAALVVTMVASGAIENVDQARGRQRNRLLTAEELEVARRARLSTEPHGLFATGLQHNHPVSMLSGRRVLMGYPGWLWSQGIDASARERDLRAIMTLAPDAPRLLALHDVDYVVVGPDEVARLGADPSAWRALCPTVLRTERYEVFSAAPIRGATDATPGPRDGAGSR